MADIRRFTLVDLILLLAVVVTAGGVRAWYVGLVGAGPAPLHVQGPLPEGDGEVLSGELAALSESLAEHFTYRGPAPFGREAETTAHRAPGYPLVVSLVEQAQLGGLSTAERVRWLQAGLGTLTAALYFLFARRAFRSRLAGALAGVFCALYPFWVFNAAELNDGTLAAFLLALSLFLGGQAGEHGGPLTSFLYGLALAALALVRAACLPFALVALAWFLYRCRRVPKGWLYALLAFLGLANGLAPWTIRNLQAYGNVFPVVDSAYLHLWVGNNPRATGGPLTDQAREEGLALSAQAGVAPTASELQEMPQDERYAALAPAVRAEVLQNPAGTLQRRLSAGLYYLFGELHFTERRLAVPSADADERLPGWLSQAYHGLLYASLLGVLLLALLGWRWSYPWRWEAMPLSLAAVWLPLPYLLGHTGLLHGPRLPLDGVLLCYAAVALAGLVPVAGSGLLTGAGARGGDRPRGE